MGVVRKLLIGFGMVEIAWPRPIIDLCERIGLENPEKAELRRGAVELARLEGLLVVWLLQRRRRGSKPIAALFGMAGAVAIVVPGPLIRLTQRVAYENTDELVLKPWVRPAARALGVFYLLITALAWRTESTEDSEIDE